MQARHGWIKGLLLCLLGWSVTCVALHPPVLTADQAFQLRQVIRPDEQSLTIHFSTAPGYALYRDRFQFKVLTPPSVRLGKPQFPSSALYRLYPDGRKLQVFAGDFDILLPALFLDPQADTLSLEIRYQGCSDAELCYPEQIRLAQLNLKRNAPARVITATAPAQRWSASENSTSTTPWYAQLWRLAAFFSMGLLLAFTPCVLPMLPILSGLILGPKQTAGTRAFGLSLSYVLGMALTYAAIGVVAGLLGSSLQAMLQIPWVLMSFALLIVIMAFALFGWFDIELPQALRQRMAAWSSYQTHGSYLGGAVMGALSTLILSPCATPALAAAMLYLAKEGQASFAALALFIMALGMGVPLLLLGAFGAKLLPKAGRWMNQCKAAMGFVLFGVAISMLGRLLPGPVTLGLWSLLALGVAFRLGFFTSTHTVWQYSLRCLALACFAYAVVLGVGAALGQSDPLHPLPNRLAATPTPIFRQATSINEWEVQRLLAIRSGQPWLVDVYANWCIACTEMDRVTFRDPEVRALLRAFYLIRVDLTANNTETRALQQRLGVIAPPSLLVFDAEGHELPAQRLVGFVAPNTLIAQLASILRETSANRRQP